MASRQEAKALIYLGHGLGTADGGASDAMRLDPGELLPGLANTHTMATGERFKFAIGRFFGDARKEIVNAVFEAYSGITAPDIGEAVTGIQRTLEAWQKTQTALVKLPEVGSTGFALSDPPLRHNIANLGFSRMVVSPTSSEGVLQAYGSVYLTELILSGSENETRRYLPNGVFLLKLGGEGDGTWVRIIARYNTLFEMELEIQEDREVEFSDEDIQTAMTILDRAPLIRLYTPTRKNAEQRRRRAPIMVARAEHVEERGREIVRRQTGGITKRSGGKNRSRSRSRSLTPGPLLIEAAAAANQEMVVRNEETERALAIRRTIDNVLAATAVEQTSNSTKKLTSPPVRQMLTNTVSQNAEAEEEIMDLDVEAAEADAMVIDKPAPAPDTAMAEAVASGAEAVNELSNQVEATRATVNSGGAAIQEDIARLREIVLNTARELAAIQSSDANNSQLAVRATMAEASQLMQNNQNALAELARALGEHQQRQMEAVQNALGIAAQEMRASRPALTEQQFNALFEGVRNATSQELAVAGESHAMLRQLAQTISDEVDSIRTAMANSGIEGGESFSAVASDLATVTSSISANSVAAMESLAQVQGALSLAVDVASTRYNSMDRLIKDNEAKRVADGMAMVTRHNDLVKALEKRPWNNDLARFSAAITASLNSQAEGYVGTMTTHMNSIQQLGAHHNASVEKILELLEKQKKKAKRHAELGTTEMKKAIEGIQSTLKDLKNADEPAVTAATKEVLETMKEYHAHVGTMERKLSAAIEGVQNGVRLRPETDEAIAGISTVAQETREQMKTLAALLAVVEQRQVEMATGLADIQSGVKSSVTSDQINATGRAMLNRLDQLADEIATIKAQKGQDLAIISKPPTPLPPPPPVVVREEIIKTAVPIEPVVVTPPPAAPPPMPPAAAPVPGYGYYQCPPGQQIGDIVVNVVCGECSGKRAAPVRATPAKRRAPAKKRATKPKESECLEVKLDC